MLYVGADLHKDQVTFAVSDHRGDILLKKRIACKAVNKITEFFTGFKQPFQLAVEAVGFYHWFWDLARPYAKKIYLANPTEVRQRSVGQPKTDYRDACRLAELLRLGLFEKDHHLRSYVPDQNLRALRHATRRRNNLTRRTARDKVSFRKFIFQCNLQGPEKLNSISGEQWLRKYETKIPPYLAHTLRHLLDTMRLYERQRIEMERAIDQAVNQLEAWNDHAHILRSLPGFGDIVVWTLIAEIGDFTRFDRIEEIVNYVGLDPRVFQSADTTRYGKIAKAGPRDARWVLQQAAWVAVRHYPRCQTIFNRVRKHAGKKKAAVAVARKLLIWAYALIKNGQMYQDHRHCA